MIVLLGVVHVDLLLLKLFRSTLCMLVVGSFALSSDSARFEWSCEHAYSPVYGGTSRLRHILRRTVHKMSNGKWKVVTKTYLRLVLVPIAIYLVAIVQQLLEESQLLFGG
jgi:hypothetical protein